MKTLVIYATIEGQTGKIAQFAAKKIKALGHEATLINAEAPENISYQGVDAVVLAASVHQRRHPRSFEALLSADADRLNKCKTLLLSVSLNAAFPEGREEAKDYVTEMKMRTRFEPDSEMLVGGAVRTANYDYFAMQVVRHVVMRNRPFDPSETEHEFTDWGAVSAQVAAFLA